MTATTCGTPNTCPNWCAEKPRHTKPAIDDDLSSVDHQSAVIFGLFGGAYLTHWYSDIEPDAEPLIVFDRPHEFGITIDQAEDLVEALTTLIRQARNADKHWDWPRRQRRRIRPASHNRW